MKRVHKTGVWIAVILLVVVGVTTLRIIRARRAARRPITVKGAVITADSDSQKQLPIADVEISSDILIQPVEDEIGPTTTKSDASGFFWIRLPLQFKRGNKVTLKFRHPQYQPLNAVVPVGDELFVAHMLPAMREKQPVRNGPEIKISNLRVRYSIKSSTTVNVGSVVKTLEVQNVANTPCHGRPPCSPDGKWKATIGSTTLDAGEGNEFRNARVSCMAGPCPFTKIEDDNFSRGGRTITVSVRDWSDPATFLIEAEVVHPAISDLVRESYPLIFENAFNFSLAGTAEGPSIEAELDSDPILFPLGPDLCLSWANCTMTMGKDQTKAYRCELKPGYRFP